MQIKLNKLDLKVSHLLTCRLQTQAFIQKQDRTDQRKPTEGKYLQGALEEPKKPSFTRFWLIHVLINFNVMCVQHTCVVRLQGFINVKERKLIHSQQQQIVPANPWMTSRDDATLMFYFRFEKKNKEQRAPWNLLVMVQSSVCTLIG